MGKGSAPAHARAPYAFALPQLGQDVVLTVGGGQHVRATVTGADPSGGHVRLRLGPGTAPRGTEVRITQSLFNGVLAWPGKVVHEQRYSDALVIDLRLTGAPEGNLRRAERSGLKIQAMVEVRGRRTITVTTDVSMTGVAVLWPSESGDVRIGDKATTRLLHNDQLIILPGKIARSLHQPRGVAIEFRKLNRKLSGELRRMLTVNTPSG